MNDNPQVRSGRAALVVAVAVSLAAGCAGVAAPEVAEIPTPSPTTTVPVADSTYAVIALDRPTEVAGSAGVRGGRPRRG